MVLLETFFSDNPKSYIGRRVSSLTNRGAPYLFKVIPSTDYLAWEVTLNRTSLNQYSAAYKYTFQ